MMRRSFRSAARPGLGRATDRVPPRTDWGSVIALAATAVAWILVLVLVIGWIVYAMFNARSARRELGSEIELAANRRPYYDDETLEGRRLELVQFIGVLLLAVIVVGLPLYWVFEPSRQDGARAAAADWLAGRGAAAVRTDCRRRVQLRRLPRWHERHGRQRSLRPHRTGHRRGACRHVDGTGAEHRPLSLLTRRGHVHHHLRPSGHADVGVGTRRRWTAQRPAGRDPRRLHRVDPDPPRGLQRRGGGATPTARPATSRRRCRRTSRRRRNRPSRTASTPATARRCSTSQLASGAYSCARCHTTGWSYGDPQEPGQGGLGWNLTGGSTNAHFPNSADMVDFIQNGTENGVGYGEQGQGSGKMPAFGALLTEEQIEAIVDYERGL